MIKTTQLAQLIERFSEQLEARKSAFATSQTISFSLFFNLLNVSGEWQIFWKNDLQNRERVLI